MPDSAPPPEIRTFNNSVTVTALTIRRRHSWTFSKGDQITNIRRIGGKVRFDAGENVGTRGTFDLDWIAFELATRQKPEQPGGEVTWVAPPKSELLRQ